MVKEHLAGDAEVEESAMLTDRVTGDSREVDVVIRGEVAGHPVVVSFECRAHARRQTVAWIEEMWGKHANLETDRLILVSESGFTNTAHRAAVTRGIETVEPRYFDAEEAQSLANRVGRVGFRTYMASKLVYLVHLPADESHDGVTFQLGDDQIDAALFTEEGTGFGPMSGLIDQILNEAPFEVAPDQFRREFELVADPVLQKNREPLFIRNADTGDLRRVAAVCIRGELRVDHSWIQLRPGELQGTHFEHGEEQIGEDTRALVVTTLDEDIPRMSFIVQVTVPRPPE